MSREHAPFVVDDPRTQFRLWRCPRCAELWAETDRRTQPISEDDASAAFPARRDHERWIATTPLRLLLQQYRSGLLGDELFVRALLPHVVLAPAGDSGTPEVLVLFSSAETAIEDGWDPGAAIGGAVGIVTSGAIDSIVENGWDVGAALQNGWNDLADTGMAVEDLAVQGWTAAGEAISAAGDGLSDAWDSIFG